MRMQLKPKDKQSNIESLIEIVKIINKFGLDTNSKNEIPTKNGKRF